MTNGIRTPVIDSRHPHAVFPAGRKPGVLPRKSRLGEICPRASEHIKLIPRDEWDERAADISLRPHVHTVLDQGSVGSCATESTAGGIMVARSMQGLTHVVLNPWFIYQKTSGGRDQGSNIDTNLAFVRQYGCAPESVWPRSKGWRSRPSDEAYDAALQFRIDEFYDIASVDEFVSAVLTGYPVVYGSAGHSVLRVEKDLDLNSWSTNWKDGGFGLWASLNAINWGYGAFAIRIATQH